MGEHDTHAPRVPGRGRWSRSTRVVASPSLSFVARKAGPLLLIAFLVAVMASGGGGVTAPWMPRSPDSPPEPVSVAEARLAIGGVSWLLHRME